MNKTLRLKNFPISFYSVILGLVGFTINLQKAKEIFKFPIEVSSFFLFSSLFIFLIITLFYFLKAIKFPEEIKKEINHPIKINFFPTFSISLLLFSIAFLPLNSIVSYWFWLSGTILHLFFTLTIVSIWIRHEKFKIKNMNPAWFIPAMGNILIPISGTSYFSVDVSWFFFSIGLFFGTILLVIFFYRVFFYEPLPEKLLPTLFILIAVPAVSFISYFKLNGSSLDNFSKILYYFSFFLTLLIFFNFKMFSQLKYYLSSWAYSFPLAALNIANALFYHVSQASFFKYLFLILTLFLTFLILFLSYKTLDAITKKIICVEEE